MSADRNKADAKLRVSAKLPADLGSFLFADVGAGSGGRSLTVLSALARLGLDPWDEAGRLAKQPDQEAASQLARSLAALPGTLLPDLDGVAARLVALLPGRAVPSGSLVRSSNTGPRAAWRRTAVLAVAGVLTGVALLLAGHLAAAGGGAAASKPPGATSGQP